MTLKSGLLCVALAAPAALPMHAYSQQAATAAPQAGNDDTLAAQATDPTAALMSFQLYDWYQPSFRDVDGSANQLVFRAALPFEFLGVQNIFRVTAPYVTSTPSGADGFGDITVFDLAG